MICKIIANTLFLLTIPQKNDTPTHPLKNVQLWGWGVGRTRTHTHTQPRTFTPPPPRRCADQEREKTGMSMRNVHVVLREGLQKPSMSGVGEAFLSL